MPPRARRGGASSSARPYDRSLARLKALCKRVLGNPSGLSLSEVQTAGEDVGVLTQASVLDLWESLGAWEAVGEDDAAGLLALYSLAIRSSVDSGDAARTEAYAALRLKLAGELAFTVGDRPSQHPGRRHLSDKQERALVAAVLKTQPLHAYAAVLADAAAQLLRRRSQRGVTTMRALLEEVIKLLAAFLECDQRTRDRGDPASKQVCLTAAVRSGLGESGLLEHWARLLLLLTPDDERTDAALAQLLRGLTATLCSMGPGVLMLSHHLATAPCFSYLLSSHVVDVASALDGGAAYGLPSGPGAHAAPLAAIAAERPTPRSVDEASTRLTQWTLRLWQHALKGLWGALRPGMSDAAAGAAVQPPAGALPARPPSTSQLLRGVAARHAAGAEEVRAQIGALEEAAHAADLPAPGPLRADSRAHEVASHNIQRRIERLRYALEEGAEKQLREVRAWQRARSGLPLHVRGVFEVCMRLVAAAAEVKKPGEVGAEGALLLLRDGAWPEPLSAAEAAQLIASEPLSAAELSAALGGPLIRHNPLLLALAALQLRVPPREAEALALRALLCAREAADGAACHAALPSSRAREPWRGWWVAALGWSFRVARRGGMPDYGDPGDTLNRLFPGGSHEQPWSWESMGRLLAGAFDTGPMGRFTQGSLTAPSPALAAALSVGYLPCLERLVRHPSGSVAFLDGLCVDHLGLRSFIVHSAASGALCGVAALLASLAKRLGQGVLSVARPGGSGPHAQKRSRAVRALLFKDWLHFALRYGATLGGPTCASGPAEAAGCGDVAAAVGGSAGGSGGSGEGRPSPTQWAVSLVALHLLPAVSYGVREGVLLLDPKTVESGGASAVQDLLAIACTALQWVPVLAAAAAADRAPADAEAGAAGQGVAVRGTASQHPAGSRAAAPDWRRWLLTELDVFGLLAAALELGVLVGAQGEEYWDAGALVARAVLAAVVAWLPGEVAAAVAAADASASAGGGRVRGRGLLTSSLLHRALGRGDVFDREVLAAVLRLCTAEEAERGFVNGGDEAHAALAGLLVPPAEMRRLLRCCANPLCANLEGPSEAALRLVGGCGRCGDPAVRYCGRECQAAHWRGGHKLACRGAGAAAAGGQQRQG